MPLLRGERFWNSIPGIAGLLATWFVWSLAIPVPMPKDPSSLLLESEDGTLLGARIAADGQWRFPESRSGIPPKVAASVIQFEDAWFRVHPGINPVSMLKAIRQNWAAGRVVRGGSTLPMQVVRLSRKGKARTYLEKLIETHAALRLVFRLDRESILRRFLAMAPFGGNVVGLDAASWRYFGKPPHTLGWGEAAALAVLPNAPGLIHPGRNRDLLLRKRNRLLRKLAQQDLLDPEACELAMEEPLPGAPLPLPDLAPELLTTLGKHYGGRLVTTLDPGLQERVRNTMARHHERLAGNGIRNMAVLLIDNRSSRVLAYAGNTPGYAGPGSSVDIIQARRSPGSTLKPMLYAWAIHDGLIWPRSWIQDIPTQYGSYRPENFHRDHEGLIPAEKAIATSLNVPMVRLLHRYGTERFLHRLRVSHGVRSLDKDAGHYGLSLVLGGGEVTLWELTQAYSRMARLLSDTSSAVDAARGDADLLVAEGSHRGRSIVPPTAELPGKGAIWSMLQAMRLPDRPDDAAHWEQFESSRLMAWKTGTSFGFKDAWAIGVTPEFTIGVWTGNADAEPRAALTGLRAAAPLLFDILDLLPPTGWFPTPWESLREGVACQDSGLPAGPHCPADTIDRPIARALPDACPYHRRILLDPGSNYRHSAACAPEDGSALRDWLVLPPVEAYFFAMRNPQYRPLPPLHPECEEDGSLETLQLIYPPPGARLVVPVGMGGERQALVFTATHPQADAEILWHLDGRYLGATRGKHQWKLLPDPGTHSVTIVDRKGNRLQRRFLVEE